MIDNQDLESYMSEEELLDDEDEADMSMLPQDVRPLLRVPVLFCFFSYLQFFFSTSFTGARKYDRNAPNKTPGREEEEPDSGDGDSEGNGRRNDSTDHGEWRAPRVCLCFFFFVERYRFNDKTVKLGRIQFSTLSRQIEELKERYQEKLEDTFEMYKDAIKEHAYQSAMNNLEDDYVPIDEFIAEEEKVEVCLRLGPWLHFKYWFKIIIWLLLSV